ncbi:putative adhesin [Pseudomonas protegens]|uniref:putative adhesin n=1 Tax=Pseudomonas protegens TaxID=380021 RepID=UPI0035654938
MGSLAPVPATWLGKLLGALFGRSVIVGGEAASLKVTGNLLGKERSLGSAAGHDYAGGGLEGGTGTAYAGHGQYRYGVGETIDPEGIAITLPREGIRITDATGQFIERGDWEGSFAAGLKNPRIANDIEGMATWLSGAKVLNCSLSSPTNLVILKKNSSTVEQRTSLSELLKYYAGCVQWAACTEFAR